MPKQHVASDHPVPEKGKSYPVRLGASFKKRRRPSAEYWGMRWHFKPDGIRDKVLDGQLVKNDVGSVRVMLPSKQMTEYKGKYVVSKATECVLVFEGDHYRLERLTGTVMGMKELREVDASKMAKASSPSTMMRRKSASEPVLRPGEEIVAVDREGRPIAGKQPYAGKRPTFTGDESDSGSSSGSESESGSESGSSSGSDSDSGSDSESDSGSDEDDDSVAAQLMNQLD